MTKSAPAFAEASFGIPLEGLAGKMCRLFAPCPAGRHPAPLEKERFTKEKEDERKKGSSSFLLWGKAKGYAGAFSRKR